MQNSEFKTQSFLDSASNQRGRSNANAFAALKLIETPTTVHSMQTSDAAFTHTAPVDYSITADQTVDSLQTLESTSTQNPAQSFDLFNLIDSVGATNSNISNTSKTSEANIFAAVQDLTLFTQTDYFNFEVTPSTAVDQEASAPIQAISINTQPIVSPFQSAFNSSNSDWSADSGWGKIHVGDALSAIIGDSVSNDTSTQDSTPTHNMGFDQAWAKGYTGQGVVIANIDTGIDLNNTALLNNIHLSNQSWNFIANNSNVQDDNGHGTATSSLLAAGPQTSGRVVGGAYGAELMVLKALDSHGNATAAHVSQAIRYAVDHGADVINLSLQKSSSDAAIFEAVEYANAHDVVVVVSSGNSAQATVSYPAYYAQLLPTVIAVGATNSNDDSIASFSNRAGSDYAFNFVDAEGASIKSFGLNNQLMYWNGTSMASAYVAAEAAILESTHKGLTAQQIIQDIVQSAQDSTSHSTTINYTNNHDSLSGIFPLEHYIN